VRDPLNTLFLPVATKFAGRKKFAETRTDRFEWVHMIFIEAIVGRTRNAILRRVSVRSF